MAIPKNELPTYELLLPSTNQMVLFRPFVVKEEKILLLALETGDFISILQGIKQVMSNCLFTEIDLDNIPLFELEYMFLNIRARSMGEKIDLVYICENVVDDKKCKNEMDVQVDLLQVSVDMRVPNQVIQLSDTLGIKLKYPRINSTIILNYTSAEVDAAVDLIKDCTEYLFDKDQTYTVEDMQEGEFQEFIEGLTQEQFTKIKDFFDGLPAIVFDKDITCDKCGKVHNIHLEGMQDFFG